MATGPCVQLVHLICSHSDFYIVPVLWLVVDHSCPVYNQPGDMYKESHLEK